MSVALCSKCGATFQRGADESWKTQCLPCFKKGKDLDRQAELKRLETRVLAAESEVVNLRGQLRQAHAEIQHFFEMAMERQAEIHALRERTTIADDLREHLPRLRQLCHPDRHNGSEAAMKASQWLNGLRARLH